MSGTDVSTSLFSTDQSSDCAGVNQYAGQRIGLFSTGRSLLQGPQSFLRHTLLCLALMPVISFGQATRPLTAQNEESLLKALLVVKSEDEAKLLLRSNRQLVTDDLWKRLKEELTKAYKSGDSSRSLFLYGIGKQIAEEMNDKPRLALILDKIGKVYLWIEDYGKAQDHSRQSLKLAEELKDDQRTLSVLLTLGAISTWQGEYNEALAELQKALALSTESNERESRADALSSIGHIYSLTGNYAQAFQFYNDAMDIVRVLNQKKKLQDLLAGLGVLYAEQGDYEKMSHYLDQALRIARETRDQTGIATVLIDLGIANREQGNIEKALQNLQEGLRTAEEIKSSGLVIDSQTALGSVYRLLGKYNLALDYLDRSCKAAEQIGDRAQVAVILGQIGELYNAEGEYSKAVEFSDRAVSLASQINLPEIAYLALTMKGKAHAALNEHDACQKAPQKAISTIEHLRTQVSGGEQDYQRFFQKRISPYHAMVSSLLAQNKPSEALDFAERAKARVLLDVLRNGRIAINKSMGHDEQAEERRLYGEVVSINARLRSERMAQPVNANRIGELESKLQTARNAYETFQTRVYAAHPELRGKRGQLPLFTIEDAGALVSEMRNAILEYVVTDEQTLLFVLRRDSKARSKAVDVKIHQIDITKSDLSNLIERHRSLLSTNHPGFRRTGRQLYDLLVKPAEAYLKAKTTICIIPDGPLWNLPFQALQTESDQYILELYAIYYAPSLQVLREMRKRSEKLKPPLSKSKDSSAESKEALYAIGNPAFGREALARAVALRNSTFVSLPETEKEVRTLAAEVYEPQASIVRVGDAAREETVKAEMGKYRVLHFASHGVFDDRNPLYSYIVLAPGSDSKEDGLLEAWELMGMDLKAELAVLSACDTARGRVGDGEGMIGMTWALFVAGVPTMVASQWQVPSERTTNLMLAFHRNLIGGSVKKISKAEAWRRAALGMITDPRYRMKPYYWAGFVVVGDGGN